jgi:hypothetical protein
MFFDGRSFTDAWILHFHRWNISLHLGIMEFKKSTYLLSHNPVLDLPLACELGWIYMNHFGCSFGTIPTKVNHLTRWLTLEKYLHIMNDKVDYYTLQMIFWVKHSSSIWFSFLGLGSTCTLKVGGKFNPLALSNNTGIYWLR